MSKQDIDPVAEFLAKGGKIQTVEAGVRAMPERQMRAMASGSDEEADRMRERSMRDAENQVGLEQYHPYFKH